MKGCFQCMIIVFIVLRGKWLSLGLVRCWLESFESAGKIISRPLALIKYSNLCRKLRSVCGRFTLAWLYCKHNFRANFQIKIFEFGQIILLARCLPSPHTLGRRCQRKFALSTPPGRCFSPLLSLCICGIGWQTLFSKVFFSVHLQTHFVYFPRPCFFIHCALKLAHKIKTQQFSLAI